MSVKISLELGHVSSLKPKPTPDGFTHDWELFVRGIDAADCSHYIDKVVFTLHESFPKPKRVVKEPPYILKESGYAGFTLPVDIYFKCRDDTKKLSYKYDLNLNITGPFSHKETQTHLFKNPSEDFRRKLLKGGGVANVADRVSNADDKSRESMDDRPQLISKPKLGGGNDSSSTKKYKTKTDDPKVSFEQLFGSSNTKSSKVSPDPKNKASPSLSASKHQQQSSGGQKSEKSSRDRPEKEKKDKNKHVSTHKEAKSLGGKDGTKKVDDKHERREEQKKDKLHSKERDRSKDKPQKQRPPSPKPRSPKRATSPAAKIAPVSSTKEDSSKLASKSLEATTVGERPSSSAKKSKKDKKDKSHDKDRDRERKDKEHKSKEERPSSKISDKISTKKDGSSTPKDAIVKEKARSTEVKPLSASDPPAEPVTATKVVPVNLSKVEKDPDRKHKHKKKDKNKDKDTSTKDRKKEKPSKSKDEPSTAPVAASPIKRQTPVDTPSAVAPAPVVPPSQIPATKPNPLNTLLKEAKASSDSEDDHQPPNIAKPAAVDLAATGSAISNIPDVPSRLIDEQPIATSQLEKLEKSSAKRGRKDTKATDKEDKKRKRKSKDEPELTRRKTPSPAVNDQEPLNKIPKKDERTIQQLPPPPPQSRNDIPSIPAAGNNLISPITTQLDHRSSPATVPYQPKSSPAPTGGAHSNSRQTPSQQQQSQQQPSSAVPNAAIDYMSELRNLQHKIMTLQNNQELQQVVEMIAETGCYEITSKTFDFDLCALDRPTVQRLLDFFAASCS